MYMYIYTLIYICTYIYIYGATIHIDLNWIDLNSKERCFWTVPHSQLENAPLNKNTSPIRISCLMQFCPEFLVEPEWTQQNHCHSQGWSNRLESEPQKLYKASSLLVQPFAASSYALEQLSIIFSLEGFLFRDAPWSNSWYCLVLLIPQLGSLASQASWPIYLNANLLASGITTLFHWRGGGFPEVSTRETVWREICKMSALFHWAVTFIPKVLALRFLRFNWLPFLKSLNFWMVLVPVASLQMLN